MLSMLFAILVIVNKNPIVSVLFLICLFVLISGYLISLGMKFIGISYLLVYIGAVSILFLFILMLINIRISEIQLETSNSLPLAMLISISFFIIAYDILPYNSSENNSINNSAIELESESPKIYLTKLQDLLSSLNTDNLNYLVSNQWDSNLVEVLHISGIGNILYTNYFLWLILASIILLLAMIGTIIINIKQ
jgi:NADH-ubiquinone oxidoreductase chain 6